MAAAEKLAANPGLEKYHILSHMAQGVLFPRGLMHTKHCRLKGREGLAGVGDRPKTQSHGRKGPGLRLEMKQAQFPFQLPTC